MRASQTHQYILALHVANSVGGAQFYMSCYQLNVGGSGSGNPSPTIRLPGGYSPTEPGILFTLWTSPKSYVSEYQNFLPLQFSSRVDRVLFQSLVASPTAQPLRLSQPRPTRRLPPGTPLCSQAPSRRRLLAPASVRHELGNAIDITWFHGTFSTEGTEVIAFSRIMYIHWQWFAIRDARMACKRKNILTRTRLQFLGRNTDLSHFMYLLVCFFAVLV